MCRAGKNDDLQICYTSITARVIYVYTLAFVPMTAHSVVRSHVDVPEQGTRPKQSPKTQVPSSSNTLDKLMPMGVRQMQSVHSLSTVTQAVAQFVQHAL